MIFLSHANVAKDNEFTRWIALRLAALGYPVWCDQTQLLGGEKFWTDIETAIRDRTTKFLMVLSRHSNERDSVMDEIAVAKRVAKEKALTDFIIPLRIDDLSNTEITIELARATVVEFSSGWAPAFAQLLKKLERDQIPKDERFSPGAVAEWWRANERQLMDVSETPEPCASNWFAIGDLPERLFLHSLADPLEDKGARELPLGVPNYREKGGIFSFERKAGMARLLKEAGMELAETQDMDRAEFQRSGHKGLRMDKKEARNIVTSLVKQAWQARCLAAGLREYELSGDQRCYWFPQGFVKDDKVSFRPIVPLPSGRTPHRRLVARPTKRDGTPQKRLWHFATQAKVIWWPRPILTIRSHVVFTEAGELLPSDKQHSARRSLCKQWYNDKWLDCMLAVMSFLHDPAYQGLISGPCGDDVGYTVSTHPLTFLSPISFGRDDTDIPEDDESEEHWPEDELDEEEIES